MTPFSSEPTDRIDEYVCTLRGMRARAARCVLESAASAVRAECGSLAVARLDSGLLATWWRERTSRSCPRTREQYFYYLHGYFRWLYEHRYVEAFVLRHFRGTQVAHEGWIRLRLKHPLQRDIDAHVDSLGACGRLHQRLMRRVLLDFERFWNRRGGGLSPSLVAHWIGDRLRRHHDKAEGFCVGILRRFFQSAPHLCPAGRNPASFAPGVSARRLAASLRAGRRIRLTCPADPKTELTTHWRRFVQLKRRLGCRYVNPPRLYRALDRYLVAQGLERLREITSDQIEQFLCRPVLPRRRTFESKRNMLGVLFGYLTARGILPSDPTRWVGVRGAASGEPYVYTHKQIHALLAAARSLPGEEERALGWYTMLHLLYACGLRIGELIRLDLGDVDLRRRCLTIRQTKFFKDRLVPFNRRVEENLRRFLTWRLRRYPPASSGDTVFLNRHHRRFSYARFWEIFHTLLEASGIRPSTPGQRASIHGLRRTFAVHRLMRWYREAADVTGKLSLLATYMGHSSWEHTRVYLTMTPALMRTAGRRFAGEFESTVHEAP